MQQLKDWTVGEFLRHTAEQFADRPALEYKDRVWTYRELDREVDRVARCLLGWGVKKGDHLGVWCEAEPNTVIMMYAGVRIGAVTALINTSLPRKDMMSIVERSDITKMVISDGYKDLNYPELCQGLTEKLPMLEGILYVGQNGNHEGFLRMEDLEAGMASEEELARAESLVKPRDAAYIIYTSGTTGFPKAVMDSHFSRVNVGIQEAKDYEATEEDRLCSALPLFHCFGLSVNMMVACAAGASLVLPDSRRTGDLLKCISEKKCTILNSVPSLFAALIHRNDFETWDVSSIRTGIIAGASYTRELFLEVEEKFPNMVLLSSLGMSEATGGLTSTNVRDDKETRLNSLGRFFPHTEGKIVDIHTGKTLPPYQKGEVCVRGYVVMQGYYKQPEETAKAIDEEGWLHMGDLGYMDDNGHLHLSGRLKDLIIRGGENIAPVEIEAAVADNERIEMCKVVGVPDPFYGEEICMCVVLREGETGTEEELRECLKRRLPTFKVPKYILFMDALPTTPTGKIRPQEVKKLARERLGL